MAVVGEEVEVLERLSVGSLWNESNSKMYADSDVVLPFTEGLLVSRTVPGKQLALSYSVNGKLLS